MLIIGHRGASGYEPENTLRSFLRAYELGANAVELDVHVCKSGEAVVIHDETLDRTTNGTGHIADKTLSELKLLDTGKGEKIPTLLETLTALKGKGITFIEMKSHDCAKPVADAVNDYISHGGSLNDVVIISFNHPLLVEVGNYLPDVRIGTTLVGMPVNYADMATQAGAWSVNPCLEFLDEKFVRDAHARGLKLLTWTCNSAESIAKAKALNVDGIFSDYPDRVTTS